MPIDPQLVRIALRSWTSGVTVVSTVYENQRVGLTASSFTSVSLTPPLVLVCLHKDTETCQMVLKAGFFGISLLAEGQDVLSEQFAGHRALPIGADRFFGVDTVTHETGAPIIADAIAWFDCRVHNVYDGSTHQIVVGEVVATGQHEPPVPPLVYHHRAYRRIVS